MSYQSNQHKYYYDLEKFLEPCDFPTDPEDKIEKVKLLMIKLKPTNNKCCLTLAVNEEYQESVYEIAHDWFDTHNPFEGGFIVYQIKLVIKFYSKELLPVIISHPCHCNLTQFSDLEQQIIIKYLKRWGLIEEY